MGKIALATGLTGEYGAYLSELPLRKGYEAHGLKRRSSSLNTGRIDHIYHDPHAAGTRLHLHYGVMTDSMNLARIVQKVRPNEFYNLAATSHVYASAQMYAYWVTMNDREAYALHAAPAGRRWAVGSQRHRS